MKVPKTSPIFIAGVVIVGVVSLFVLRLFVFNYNRIPQGGMYPGMPAGSWFITKRSPYQNIHDIKRGDVVVFTRKGDKGTYNYVWRVIGLPDDLVQVSDESVILNGKPLKHEEVRTENEFRIVKEWIDDRAYDIAYDQGVDRTDLPPHASVTVPKNHIFVLGDNRYRAEDSTYLGPIPFESIVEKKIF